MYVGLHDVAVECCHPGMSIVVIADPLFP